MTSDFKEEKIAFNITCVIDYGFNFRLFIFRYVLKISIQSQIKIVILAIGIRSELVPSSG